GRIFRPYRDVRFSADKSPYKTQIGATVGEGYVQLNAEGLAAGSGMWEMAPDQLERYRRTVADDRSGGELASVVTKAAAAGLATGGDGRYPGADGRTDPARRRLRGRGRGAGRRLPRLAGGPEASPPPRHRAHRDDDPAPAKPPPPALASAPGRRGTRRRGARDQARRGDPRLG